MEAFLKYVPLEILNSLFNCIPKNDHGSSARMPLIGVFLWQRRQEDVAVVPSGP